MVEGNEAPAVELKHSQLILPVRPETDERNREEIVEAWYRQELKKAVPALIAKWETLMGVKVERFFVQRMKTR